MPGEIAKPFVDAGAWVGTDPTNQVVCVLAGDGSYPALTSWNVASGDAHYYAPAGTDGGGGTRRHLFDGEVYANTGTRSVPVYSNVRAFGSITGKPTTLGGYGITDALPNNANGTTTGTITSAGILVTAAAATARSTTYQTAGSTRWTAGASSVAESGSNAGSSYRLDAYTDAAAFISTALELDRIAAGNIKASRHLIPSSDNAFDNGVSGNAWRNGRFGGTVTATTFVGALTGAATTLATPRNINGVAFDGSANITVTAAAGTVTGTTLNAAVVTSSLTSVGTLTSLVFGGNVTAGTDNAFNIGAIASGRPSLIFAAGAITGSSFLATTGANGLSVNGGASGTSMRANIVMRTSDGSNVTRDWYIGSNVINSNGDFHINDGASFGKGIVIANTTGWLGVGIAPAYPLQLTASNPGDYVSLWRNTAVSSPFGWNLTFSGASPNNNTNTFTVLIDSTAVRGQWYSNGGIANFSANNVNLSDELVKLMGGVIDGRRAADVFADLADVWQLFQYKDQTPEDDWWNIGAGARALAAKLPTDWRPSIIDPQGWQMKDGTYRYGIHETDLNYLSHAALSNLSQRVVAIETQIGTAAGVVNRLDDLSSRVAAIEKSLLARNN